MSRRRPTPCTHGPLPAQRLASFSADVYAHQVAALGAAEALAAHHDAMAAHLVSAEGRLGAVLSVLDRVAVYAATAVQLQAYVVA